MPGILLEYSACSTYIITQGHVRDILKGLNSSLFISPFSYLENPCSRWYSEEYSYFNVTILFHRVVECLDRV